MACRLTSIGVAAILVLHAVISAAEPPPNIYQSPNRALRALLVALPNAPYGLGESRVEIRNGKNVLLFSHSFGSEDGEHGFGVAQAAWTPDSQFFVFSLMSSGGHQPWHSPIYFVSRRDNRMRSLDDYLGDITDPNFEVRPPDIVQAVGRRVVGGEDETFKTRLSHLQMQNPGKVSPANPRLQRPAATSGTDRR
jgi:hypothetical protein